MSRGVRAGNAGRGSHWIRDEKRIRIYERDSWKCVWCGCAVAMLSHCKMHGLRTSLQLGPGETFITHQATLDHVLPRTRGGSNHHGNLVTSCSECNEARGERSAIDHAWELGRQEVAQYGREDHYPLLVSCAVRILDRVIEAMGRELPPAVKKPKAA